MNRLYVDVHVLQTIPPSNVNRDDTGSPKTALYGGVRRARVSSQAWKRATRTAFAELLDTSQLGTRTQRVVGLVAERIAASEPGRGDAETLAKGVLEAAGIKIEEAKRRSSKRVEQADGAPSVEGEALSAPEGGLSGYLMFLSSRQIQGLADYALSCARKGVHPDKKTAKQLVSSKNSVDISLFGRMVADAADLGVDAAAQVAHALSVHAVDNEFDYFTAVDDCKREDESGAAMIGTVEFNSSTLYRYATVNVGALRENLGVGIDSGADLATVRAVQAFVRAFVTSMPTGKQNTFANRTLPEAVLVQVRTTQPINLVCAFESAVTGSGSRGRLEEASRRLVRHARDIEQAYGDPPLASLVVAVGEATAALTELGTAGSFEELLQRLGELVEHHQPVPVAS